MRRYLSLWLTFLKANLLLELEYRANLIAGAALGVFWAGVSFVSVAVFYLHTETVGGWDYAQALVVLGLFIVMQSVISAVLSPNLQRVVEMVREGTMDFVLIKPADAQFLATLRFARYASVADLTAGVLVIAQALQQMDYKPSWSALAAFFGAALAGLLTLYGIWAAMAALAFWFVKIENLSDLFQSIFETARFPISAYSTVLRFLLTFVLPIAFLTTVPAQALIGIAEPPFLAAAAGVAALAVGFSRWLWRRALRTYTSASS